MRLYLPCVCALNNKRCIPTIHVVTAFHVNFYPHFPPLHPGRAWSCLRAPGIVPWMSFSRQLPCFLMVWPYNMLASLLWQCLAVPSLPKLCKVPTHLFSFAVHEARRIFLSPFISKSWRVYSFFLSVLLSQPYVAVRATLALSLVVSSLKSVICDFSIFSALQWCPDRLPLFNLAKCRNIIEILSLIFQKLKKSRDSDHALDWGKFVVHRLGLAMMITMHTKFEV